VSSRKRSADPIKRLTLADGSLRYRFVVDSGFHPNGKRRQTTQTYATRDEAVKALARLRTEVADGHFIAPDQQTVAHLIDAWLASKNRKIRPATQQCYRVSLAHARDALAHLPAQRVTQRDVDLLIDRLLTEPMPNGKPRSPRTVALMVGLLKTVFTYAERQKLVKANPVAYVEPIGKEYRAMKCWTHEQRATFLAHTADDPLAAGWLLTGMGLRRGEVLALRWDDVELDGAAPYVKITRTRGEADGQVREGEPKSARSRRTLPLSGNPAAVALLKRTLLAQKAQRLEAGPGVWHQDAHGGYVVADGLGRPLNPNHYSKRFTALCEAAEVPVIRLHDARHTSVTLMLDKGIAVHIVAAWHGHDPKMTYSVYAHPNEDGLTLAGAALAL
jgi:integrase